MAFSAAERLRSTTIFCVLAENNVPLPQTETRLFEERMRLLFGLYDIHKQAVRLKSDHRLLELVARKIAFYFHKRIIRNEEKLHIISIISNILGDKFPVEQLTIAVEELIDPCNILVPMSEDGAFGFGHLSFQEYLTATELCQNRGLKIGPYLKIAWWRRTLVYFSQITDDIQFILNKVVEECRVSEVYDTLTAMLEVRPAKERYGLKTIIDKNYEQDYFDNSFDIYESSIDNDFQNIYDDF